VEIGEKKHAFDFNPLKYKIMEILKWGEDKKSIIDKFEKKKIELAGEK
jgi:hypothetical protein